MPCKIMKKNCGSGASNKVKQNLRVFWKLMNLREYVWEIRYRIIIKTILQEKERIHYSTTIWFTNLSLCLKLWKFLQRKQRWKRNGKNWRNFRRGMWRKSEVSKKWSMKQGCPTLQFILHHECTSWRMSSWRQITNSIKVELYSEVTLEKTTQGLTQYSLNKDLQHLKWQQQKSHGYHLQIVRLRWISSRRSISLYRGKNLRCSQIIEKFKIGVSRHLDSSTTTRRPKSWSSMEDPVVPLERNLYGHPFWQDYYGKGNLRKSYWNTTGRKFQIGNVSLYIVKKDYSYLCMWMT